MTLSHPPRIAVLVGSLRRDSYTRKVAQGLTTLAADAASFSMIEIGDLPLYNQDLEVPKALPAPWKRLREQISASDAVLFATPEYNRSVPAALKNALDVGSRPPGQSVWNNKPAAVISVTPGALGGFGANHHLRQSLVFLNMPTLQQPEAYIGGVASLLADNGGFVSAGTRKFLSDFMARFIEWVARNER